MDLSDDQLKAVSKLALDIEAQTLIVQDCQESLDRAITKLRELEEKILPEKFAELGLAEVKLKDGSSVSIRSIYRGHISRENTEKAFEWLRDNNHGDLIKNEVKVQFGRGEDLKAKYAKDFLEKNGVSFSDREAVHPQSLSAFIRDQTERGKALPHDLLGVYIGQKATIKKGK